LGHKIHPWRSIVTQLSNGEEARHTPTPPQLGHKIHPWRSIVSQLAEGAGGCAAREDLVGRGLGRPYASAMRNRGTRYELLRTRPHDHIAWVFSGGDEFAALAASFLAEGAARGERLMYVAEDPRAEPIGLHAFEPAVLTVASIDEVYGSSGVVDPLRQRTTFADSLAEARAAGYTGIRVAADNSSLVLDPDRLAAWVQWEVVADRFMSENPVTGLCAFDRRRVDVDRLRHLATLHPLSCATAPVPQFRLYIDDDGVRVEGHVDTSAIEQLRLALDNLPPKTNVLVELTDRPTIGKELLFDLSRLCDLGTDVTINVRPGAFRALADVPIDEDHFHVVSV
jgi:hypothetical protein